MNKAELDESEV